MTSDGSLRLDERIFDANDRRAEYGASRSTDRKGKAYVCDLSAEKIREYRWLT